MRLFEDEEGEMLGGGREEKEKSDGGGVDEVEIVADEVGARERRSAQEVEFSRVPEAEKEGGGGGKQERSDQLRDSFD